MAVVEAACTRGRRDARLGGQGHARERTLNMPLISLTLDVFVKLSGWLNADAPCRVQEGVHAMRSERHGPGGGRAWRGGGGGSAMHAMTPGVKARREAPGHARERTSNMPFMPSTPDVLKLSGWSNAFAFCRV